MRVLHVAQPTTAGVAQVVLQLVEDQVQRGWKVWLASPGNGRLLAAAGEKGAVALQWDARRSPGLATLGEAVELARIVRNVRPDIVHLHSAKAGLVGRLVIRGSVRTIYQPHAWSFHATRGPMSTLAIMWERCGARWTSVLLAVSQEELNEGLEIGVRGRCAVVPNGVDVSRLALADKAMARSALGLSAIPTVVCVGRVTRQKGQDCLLQAWPLVRAQVATARLFIVGDGPELGRLRSVPVDGVTFVGHSDQASDWLAAADVAVLPSRWEGGSLVLLEAMASGRPVVATAVAGVTDYLPASAGAIVPVGDTVAMASAIIDRLLHPELCEAEGDSARRAASRHHDWRRLAAKVSALYEPLPGV